MYTGKELSEFAAEARKAGDEGWEAVGQVNLTGGNTNVPVLMLKRRAD
jgi:hypothetical protein